MSDIQAQLRTLGLELPTIMVPKKGIDLERWAVVACDQFTSEPEYWQDVAAFVADNPSTLHMIFPECYLDEPNPNIRINAINAAMRTYLENNIFDSWNDCFFLVQRRTETGALRWGLMVALDLEHYDFAKDSRSLIRATEGTILSRIPPRKEIRKDAPLELPHILVLINDPTKTVIEPFISQINQLTKVYETHLMQHGGSVAAWAIQAPKDIAAIAQAIEGLKRKLDPKNPLLFAMGDGNHSLATAKSCWMDIKESLEPSMINNHPARFALVEIENIFDEGLLFEPIHRVLFDCKKEDFFKTLLEHCKSYETKHMQSLPELEEAINQPNGQYFGYGDAQGLSLVTVTQAESSLSAGTLQLVIDELLTEKKAEVDYIHGAEVTFELGQKPGNIALFMPVIDKYSFFDSIICDGALPRKTFSMGEAQEKRYYMEARKITL